MGGQLPAIAVTLFERKEPISKAKTMSHLIRNRTLIVVILGSLSTISPFAIDMYLAAFPQIAEGLHTTTARISLSVASYFPGLATGQFIYGPLLDRFGRTRPLYAGLMFLVGTHWLWFGLGFTLALLFIILSTLGLAFPNAAALALVPFDHNIGSASAMLGFLQISVSGLASASIGILNTHDLLPVTVILAATSWIGLAIFHFGQRRISSLRFLEEKGAAPLA